MKTILRVVLVIFLSSCVGEKNTPSYEDENIGFENTEFLEKYIDSQSGSQKMYKDILEGEIIQNIVLYDFESDDSYQKFVNPETSFHNTSYVPDDLEKIGGEFIIDSKGNQTLRKQAVENLHFLGEAFYQEFSKKIVVVSAYRSYAYQKGIKDRGCSDLYCAKAGYSEHQSGLAFDMFEATNEKTFLSKPHLKRYFEWMKENAHLYGFHNTYQKGREIDGYAIEPWHWRYVGIELATELKQQEKTFAEYVNEK